MRYFKTIVVAASFLLMGGCSLTSMSNAIKGPYYLSSGKFQQGEKTFSKVVAEHPESASGHYYLGRFLLARHMTKAALPHLIRASALEGDNADYLFWRGLAYGLDGRTDMERASYEQALRIDPEQRQALLNLGNLDLRSGRYTAALQEFDRLLEQLPRNGSGLYNRALALRFLGRKSEEKQAWLSYLKWYPSGYLAGRAADHLNGLGDFSYRNHYLGKRTVTLKEITFTSAHSHVLAREALPSLRLVGAIISNRPASQLQIIVFQKHDTSLAHQRAEAIRSYLLKNFSEIGAERVHVSWFGKSETLMIEGKKHTLPQAVMLFSS